MTALNTIYSLGGAYFVVFSVLGRSPQQAPWVRWLFLAAGVALIVDGACFFVIGLVVGQPMIFTKCLQSLHWLSGGFAAGNLVALFVSGEISYKTS